MSGPKRETPPGAAGGERFTIRGTCKAPVRIPYHPCPGGYQWRRDRGLLVLSDLVRAYRAIRCPRDAYFTPMPEDVLPCWRPGGAA